MVQEEAAALVLATGGFERLRNTMELISASCRRVGSDPALYGANNRVSGSGNWLRAHLKKPWPP